MDDVPDVEQVESDGHNEHRGDDDAHGYVAGAAYWHDRSYDDGVNDGQEPKVDLGAISLFHGIIIIRYVGCCVWIAEWKGL